MNFVMIMNGMRSQQGRPLASRVAAPPAPAAPDRQSEVFLFGGCSAKGQGMWGLHLS